MISRNDDAGVVYTTSRRSDKEISHFFASQRAGGFEQSSALLVVMVEKLSLPPRALNLARIRSAQLIWFESCTPMQGYIKIVLR